MIKYKWSVAIFWTNLIFKYEARKLWPVGGNFNAEKSISFHYPTDLFSLGEITLLTDSFPFVWHCFIKTPTETYAVSNTPRQCCVRFVRGIIFTWHRPMFLNYRRRWAGNQHRIVQLPVLTYFSCHQMLL